MLIFVVTEVMFFAAFISAYRIVAAGAPDWPPADQPRIHGAATVLNTAILLVSGLLVFLAHRSTTRDRAKVAKRQLVAGVLLGAGFVVFQGIEWVRLLHYGFTVKSGSFGGFFYVIIGAHALHAVAALVAWAFLLPRFLRGIASRNAFLGTQIFWYFVVGIWPILYLTVYFT